jgi:capsular exopolysaccharide synthesis family protein
MAFFFEYLDNKIKDPEEVESALGSPVLGLVPLCRASQGEIEGIVLKEPLSSFAENYKMLRSTLLLSAADAPPRKIVITSPGVGEGKTATAINLALALAQSEKTVVLIDADMRKPRIHKIFKMANDIGLSTYLAGANAGGILKKGTLPNLSVITSGPVPPNPADLIASARMQSLIEFLSDKFDFIICDAPPTLVVADARVMSRNFEGTLLVIKAHQTTFEMAARAIKSLKDVNAKVLGLMINGLDPKKSDHYYGEYYSTYPKHVKSAPIGAGAKN